MYLLPGVRRIHEGGVLYLFIDVFIFVEGKSPGERDVDDDPSAPHVQGPVVALVTEHLGGKVGWGTNYRLSEPLFSNYSRESEVTQLYLEDGFDLLERMTGRCKIKNREDCAEQSHAVNIFRLSSVLIAVSWLPGDGRCLLDYYPSSLHCSQA